MNDLSQYVVSPSEVPPHHKMSILDLPIDVLKNFFDYFRDDGVMSKGRVEWSLLDYRTDADDIARGQTIRNARLVCRLFHDLALPHLCPVLRVQLDRVSLDRVDKISHSPRLAASVYGIQVVLHYRPKELAVDLSWYTACRQKELEEMSRRCEYYAETWFLSGHDIEDETICPLPYRQYEKGIMGYRDISSAWSEVVRRREEEDEYHEEEEVEDQDFLEYQRILLQGHEAYRKKHEEQFRLIADGSFVNSLAASMSRMFNADSLGFIDKIARGSDPYFDDPTLLLTNMDELRQLMIKPHDWATIEQLGGSPELPPPKLLAELPIAIHKAGVRIRDVNIGCFPVTKNHTMVCPDRQDASNPAWSDLRAACQWISKFEFGSGSMNNKPLRYDYLPADQQNAMDKYLGAMLSGQNLEIVNLSFYVFGLNDGKSGKDGFHRVGKILEAAVWPRISRLTIGNASMSQSELERFCTGLGYSLTYLYWHSMELSNGNWTGALDILRDRIGTRGLEGRCKLNASGLTGGGFGKPRPEKRLDPWAIEAWDLKPEPSIVLRSMDYVLGVSGTGNPLIENRH